MKHEETYEEMVETGRELPLGKLLNHLVTTFQAASCVVGFIHE